MWKTRATTPCLWLPCVRIRLACGTLLFLDAGLLSLRLLDMPFLQQAVWGLVPGPGAGVDVGFWVGREWVELSRQRIRQQFSTPPVPRPPPTLPSALALPAYRWSGRNRESVGGSVDRMASVSSLSSMANCVKPYCSELVGGSAFARHRYCDDPACASRSSWVNKGPIHSVGVGVAVGGHAPGTAHR